MYRIKNMLHSTLTHSKCCREYTIPFSFHIFSFCLFSFLHNVRGFCVMSICLLCSYNNNGKMYSQVLNAIALLCMYASKKILCIENCFVVVVFIHLISNCLSVLAFLLLLLFVSIEFSLSLYEIVMFIF